MAKVPNTVGGGAKTNFNGLSFEGRTDLREAIKKHPKYTLSNGEEVLKDGVIIAKYFEKHGLYKKFLEPQKVDHKKILSKRLLPDGALLVGNTLYIIEKKYQAGAGSVDEKLQTCDFKKKQYTKLLNPIGVKVEFYYVLNSWFDQASNKDVFDYIESVGCRYFIENLPLSEIGL
jgi:hypothetical protein